MKYLIGFCAESAFEDHVGLLQRLIVKEFDPHAEFEFHREDRTDPTGAWNFVIILKCQGMMFSSRWLQMFQDSGGTVLLLPSICHPFYYKTTGWKDTWRQYLDPLRT